VTHWIDGWPVELILVAVSKFMCFESDILSTTWIWTCIKRSAHPFVTCVKRACVIICRIKQSNANKYS
jgi:hypothetical protein